MMKPRLAATTYGFTLLEMLLVVFLMGMLAVAATAMVDGFDDQQRFELTRARWEQVRQAVIGDDARTLNGEPDIRGFAADMGRLPENIQELVDPDGLALWGVHEITISGVSGVLGNIWGGWRGPYLESLPGQSGVSFYDGWGTAGSPPNYGWVFGENPTLTTGSKCEDVVVTIPNDTITMLSCGKDGVVSNPLTAGDYDKDFPANNAKLVQASDWLLGVSSVPFSIKFNKYPNSTQSDLKLKIFYFDDTDLSMHDSGSFELLGLSSVSGVQPDPQSVTINPPAPLSKGRYAAFVVCSGGQPFDGDCTEPFHAPYYFTILPGMLLPISIPWNIQ